ncbi:MAG: amidohydrolase family protein [Dehalococcoidia bacterium]|nr:amidohydrolase family protein [Dehalococcoidia bacterium]
MIVDAFTHIVPSSYLDKLSTLGGAAVKKKVEQALGFVKGRPHATDPVRRVALLKKYGIDYQVVTLMHNLDCNVLSIPQGKQLKVAQAINDGLAGLMEQSKGKLLGVAAVPLSVLGDGGLKEMERAVKGLGLKGFCLPSNIHGKPIDAPEFGIFWAKAVELGVPVFIHPTNPQDPNSRPYEAQYDMTHVFGWPFETVLMLSRLVFSGIMERYPTLNVVSHHLGGGMVPFLFGRIEESYISENQERVLGRKLTKPLKELFGRFYYDTAVGGNAAAVKCCYDVFGADRMLLCTDSPHGPKGGEVRLESYPSIVRECGIPKAAVDKILGGNAKKLLKIK